MHTALKHVLFVLLALLAIPKAKATDIKSVGVPYVQNYTKAMYQSGNQNWSITKDEHGIMYFGNSDGLLSFDGKYWQLHRMPHGLIVRSVAADGKGKIYAGGFGEFGYWENNQQGFLIYHSLTSKVKQKSFLNEEIWKIYVDDNRVIFQSFGCLYIYENGRMNVIRINTAQPFLFAFKLGHRFFVEHVGTGLFELKGGHLELIPGSQVLGTDGVLSILPFQDKGYIIGTSKSGLFFYDGKTIKPWSNQANNFLQTYQLNNGALVAL